jgi:hypothetical protein
MPHCYISLGSEAVEISDDAVPEPIPNEHTAAGALEEPDQDTNYPSSLKDPVSCLQYASHMVTRCSKSRFYSFLFRLLLLTALSYKCHGSFITFITGNSQGPTKHSLNTDNYSFRIL